MAYKVRWRRLTTYPNHFKQLGGTQQSVPLRLKALQVIRMFTLPRLLKKLAWRRNEVSTENELQRGTSMHTAGKDTISSLHLNQAQGLCRRVTRVAFQDRSKTTIADHFQKGDAKLSGHGNIAERSLRARYSSRSGGPCSNTWPRRQNIPNNCDESGIPYRISHPMRLIGRNELNHQTLPLRRRTDLRSHGAIEF